MRSFNAFRLPAAPSKQSESPCRVSHPVLDGPAGGGRARGEILSRGEKSRAPSRRPPGAIFLCRLAPIRSAAPRRRAPNITVALAISLTSGAARGRIGGVSLLADNPHKGKETQP